MAASCPSTYSPPPKPLICLWGLFFTCASSAGTSSPRGLNTPPPTSVAPTTLKPLPYRNFAAELPTLPKPWTATVLCAGCSPSRSAAAIITVATPRPVASPRPWLPPISMGLPVTTPGTE